MLVLLVGIFISGFTWHGRFDPKIIAKWPMVKTFCEEFQIVHPEGIDIVYICRVIHKVPEGTNIKTIKAYYADFSELPFSYWYYEGSTPHVFNYNSEKDEYVEYKLTQKEARMCIECHNKQKDNRQPKEEKKTPPSFNNEGAETLQANYQSVASHLRGNI